MSENSTVGLRLAKNVFIAFRGSSIQVQALTLPGVLFCARS